MATRAILVGALLAALLIPAGGSAGSRTAPPGAWEGAQPQTFTYQWRRCDGVGGACADIGGAAASTYQLKDVDVGHTLRVRVTAHNARGSRSATSTPTAVVAKAGIPAG